MYLTVIVDVNAIIIQEMERNATLTTRKRICMSLQQLGSYFALPSGHPAPFSGAPAKSPSVCVASKMSGVPVCANAEK